MGAAIEFPHLFPIADHGAVTGGSKKRWDTCAPGADALGKSSLGIQFELYCSLEDHLFQEFVFAYVGPDVFAYLSVSKQKSQPEAVYADIV